MLRRQSYPLDPMSFLAGTSEMARRIRDFDWASHPFGVPAAWPQSLRSALSVCLHSAFPTAIYWGPELRLLYNDAWSVIPGPRHPAALGAPACEVWSDIWHIIEPQFASVIETGNGVCVEDQMLPMQRFGYVEETYWNYSFTSIRGEDGQIAGVFNSGSETTRHVLAKRQMRFLLDLAEALRSAPDSARGRQAALKMLGTHLGVDRVGLREPSPATGELSVADQWEAGGGKAEAVRDVRIPDLGAPVARMLEAGDMLRVDNIADGGVAQELRETLSAIGVSAAIAVPWIDRGKPVAVLFAHSRTPRHWSEYDLSTAEEALERIWAWIEREQAKEREAVMIREIDHRAKNALAVAKAIVNLTQADDVESYREKIEDRIASLARAHTLLARENWSKVDLSTILKEEFAPYFDGAAGSIVYEGPPIELPPEKAQGLTLVIHELTTNAAKYGALSDSGGKLSVRWTMEEDMLDIEWTEQVPRDRSAGTGLTGGFGTKLIVEIVQNQFEGTIRREMTDGTLLCFMQIPMQGVRPAPASQEVAGTATGRGVLIVEDEAIIRFDMEDMVKQLGFEIFGSTGSVGGALQALETRLPELALVDRNLGGESSGPVIALLRRNAVPTVIASGYAKDETDGETTNLVKPFSIAELESAIERARSR